MRFPKSAFALPLLMAASVHAEPAAPQPQRPAAKVKCKKDVANCKKKPRLEVAFVLDATGSMGPYINQARSRIKEIATDLASGDPAPEVKFALVTYRDRSDTFTTHVEPFSSEIAEIKKHLDNTRAGGGGDTPEAVLEGIEAALTKLHWSSSDERVIKMVYLIGDAPAKHYSNGPTESSVTELARKKGVVLHTIVCGKNLGGDGSKTWDQLARLTEGRMLHLGDSQRVARGQVGGAPNDFASVVGGTSKAYSASVGVNYDSEPALKTAPMTAPGTETSFHTGLIGAHVRWVRDPLSWSDLWAAHVSVLPAAERPPIPVIDFATTHVVIAGGAEHGLAVSEVRGSLGSRGATVKPLESGGVAFVMVPVNGGTSR